MKRFRCWPSTAVKSCRVVRTSFRRWAIALLQFSRRHLRHFRNQRHSQSNRTHIRIGGLTTWSEVIAAPLPRCFDALKSAAREIGADPDTESRHRGRQSLQRLPGRRRRASVACTRRGSRTCFRLQEHARVPLADFIVGNRKTLRRPDEILTSVIVPRRLDDAASAFLKLGARRYLVISIAMVAAIVKKVDAAGLVDAARIAVGSCSAAAQRLFALEQRPGGRARAHAAWAQSSQRRNISRCSHPSMTCARLQTYRNDAALTLIGRALDACVESG